MRREVECRATWFGLPAREDDIPTVQPVVKLTLELNDSGHDAGEYAELVQQAIAEQYKEWLGSVIAYERDTPVEEFRPQDFELRKLVKVEGGEFLFPVDAKTQGGENRKSGSRRGRPKGSAKSAKQDKQLSEAWKSGGYDSMKDVDATFELSPGSTHAAHERHRKKVAAEKKRLNKK